MALNENKSFEGIYIFGLFSCRPLLGLKFTYFHPEENRRHCFVLTWSKIMEQSRAVRDVSTVVLIN